MRPEASQEIRDIVFGIEHRAKWIVDDVLPQKGMEDIGDPIGENIMLVASFENEQDPPIAEFIRIVDQLARDLGISSEA